MANLLRALRTEIKAATRGESKAALASIRTELESIRKALTTLERRIEKGATSGASRGARGMSKADEGRRARFSPGLMRKHREALGMSRKNYAKLLGVSSLSVYLWEASRTRPRRATIFAWQDLRKKGVRELRAIAGVEAPKRGRAAARAAKRALTGAMGAKRAKRRGVKVRRRRVRRAKAA